MKLNDIQAGEYFTVDEAAEMLNKGRESVTYALARQVVQPIVVGRMVLLSPEHIQKLRDHFSRRKSYVRHVVEHTSPGGVIESQQEGGE